MRSREDEASRHRRELRELLEKQSRVAEVFFARGELVKGQVYETSGRCGKPNCGCAGGELHGRVALAVLTRRGRRNRALCAVARERVEPLTRRYRCFREARAKLVRLQKEVIARIDALEEALAVDIDLDSLRA